MLKFNPNERINLNDNRKEIRSVSYYIDGKIHEEGNYINFLTEGLHKSYHPNGELKNEGNYINGKKEGIFKEFYNNGKICKENFN